MIRASRILVWFGLTIAASLMLYQTSDRVHGLDQELHNLNTSIEAEQQSLHVLKAEWVYLANPQRVEALATRHLALHPTSTQRVIRLADLDEVLPSRSESVARVAVTATPIASVESTLTNTTITSGHLSSAAKAKKAAVLSLASTGHINEHMNMQRTASAQPLPNSIGALIEELGAHP